MSMTYEFFTEKELRCKCGCARADMDLDMMKNLVALRRELGFPFIVTSAFRCPVHNNNVSSTGMNGPHTTGKAIDIKVSGTGAYKLVEAAMRHGFTGIGVQQRGLHENRFIHLDTITEGPRPWLWTYG